MKKLRPMLFLGMVFCSLFAFAAPCFAAEPLRCTVHCESAAAAPVAGVTFSFYQVATVSGDNGYVPTAAFEKYAIALDGLSAAETKAAAETLAAYAARDQLIPTDQGLTDANGNAAFPNHTDSLKEGLYLLVGDPFVIDGAPHRFEPTLLELPARGSGGSLLYHVMCSPKHSEDTAITSLTVTKSWQDNNSSSRPSSVEAELLRDGAVYATATLNAENNWRHSWDNLPADSDWQVTEKTVPDHYTVQIQREGNSVVITNTRVDDSKDPNKDTNTSNGTSSKKDNNSSSSSSSSGSTSKKLPQTGMLQWPVPVLAAGGLLFLLLGLLRRYGER